MTVKTLITILQKYPPNTRVMTQRYSEFRELTVDDVSTVRVLENGGYWSKAYRPQDEVKTFEAVYFEGN